MLEGARPLTTEDVKTLDKVSQLATSRRKAQIWAHRDIKFLVYDDTSVRDNGYDSDDEEGMLSYAMGISNEDADISLIRRKRQKIQCEASSSNEQPEYQGCFCGSVPDLPTTFQIRKLRLVKAPPSRTELSFRVCSHYVATSYCWPPPDPEKSEAEPRLRSSYQIRDLDGRIRPARALDSVIDRAIETAISCGFRMIWIDQECLPQPGLNSPQDEKDEQELGVQAMDVVYSRSCLTAGLLSTTKITSQEQMDAIQTMLSWEVVDGPKEVQARNRNTPCISERDMYFVLELLENLIVDRWFTRAWVAQEAMSGNYRLMIVFSKSKDISHRLLWTFKHPVRSPYGDPHMKQAPTVLVLPVEELMNLLNLTKVMARMFKNLGAFAQDVLDRAEFVVYTAKRLHPEAAKAKVFYDEVWIAGANSYGPKMTVDAASAATLLSTRGCRDVQDRVTIVANMCDFDNRLNSFDLAASCRSLRIAMLALCIKNGDYTLLVPEAFGLGDRKQLVGITKEAVPRSKSNFSIQEQADFRWLWPISVAPHLLNQCITRPGGFVSSSIFNDGQVFTGTGVNLCAYFFNVQDTFDFSPIKFQWEDEWNWLRCFRLSFREQKDDESDGDYSKCMREVKLRVRHDQDAMVSAAYAGDEIGLRMTGPINASIVNDIPKAQRIIARIIFSVLRFLFQAEDDDRARSIANSIWHSVRATATSDREELPDKVGEWLFSDPLILDDPYSMLQLDVSPNGGFAQIWLLEKIMADGYLWVGNYVATDKYGQRDVEETPDAVEADKKQGSQEPLPSNDSENERSSVLETVESSDTKDKGKEVARRSDASEDDDVAEDDKEDYASKSILQRQAIRKMTALMVGVAGFGSSSDDMKTSLDRRNIATLTVALSQLHSSKVPLSEIETRRSKELVAVFDVDGPCLVSIPHCGEWEMLPRPEVRSMSICWVVDMMNHDSSRQRLTEIKQDARFRVKDKVRGMFQLIDDLPPRFEFI